MVFRLHDVLALEELSANQKLGRFVIVDDYDIAGGGIITEVLEPYVNRRTKTYSVASTLVEKVGEKRGF